MFKANEFLVVLHIHEVVLPFFAMLPQVTREISPKTSPSYLKYVFANFMLVIELIFLFPIISGSLLNLAKQPSSTVQILGAEKALFRCG